MGYHDEPFIRQTQLIQQQLDVRHVALECLRVGSGRWGSNQHSETNDAVPSQIAIIQGILSDINVQKGESECQYYIDKLEYLDDRQRDPLIDSCKSLSCHGELRNKSGSVSIQTERCSEG